MKLCKQLWANNIPVRFELSYTFIIGINFFFKAEMVFQKNPKFLNQVQYCEKQEIPMMVILGEEEVQKKQLKIRDVKQKTEVVNVDTELLLIYIQS